jgi:hypothetical protein
MEMILMHQHVNVTPTTFNLEMDTELANRYRREASARNISVRNLLLELLDVITADKLIDAILDVDAEPPPDPKIGRPRKVVSALNQPRKVVLTPKLKGAAVG